MSTHTSHSLATKRALQHGHYPETPGLFTGPIVRTIEMFQSAYRSQSDAVGLPSQVVPSLLENVLANAPKKNE